MKAARIWLAVWFLPAWLILVFHGLVEPHALENSFGGPSLFHPMGFDSFGRDLLWITLKASALSAAFALAATLIAIAAGILLGSLIALSPPGLRALQLRALEFTLAFPYLLLALGWAAISGPGWDTLLVALAIGTIPGFVRLMHLRADEILAEEFVLAARSMGAGCGGILRRHLVPALRSLAMVKFPNLFAHALIAEAALSFIGIGAPAGRDTWGTLLAQGRDYLIEAPHIAIGCGIPLVLTVLSLQKLSEKKTPYARTIKRHRRNLRFPLPYRLYGADRRST